MNTNTDRSKFEIDTNLIVDTAAASLLDEYVYGRGMLWDPVYPHHRTPRRCLFYVEIYDAHAVSADYRDQCDQGSICGENPLRNVDGGDDD